MKIRKGRPIRKSAGITVVLIAVAALLFAGVWHEAALDRAQRDFTALLEENAGRFNEGRLVLASTNSRDAQRIADTLGGSLRITKNGRFALVTLPDEVTLMDVAGDRALRRYMSGFSLDYRDFSVGTEDTDVAAEGDIRANFQTDEPMYPQQTYLDYINIGDSWNVSMGKKTNGGKVTVAIIDSGIDTDHPEFTDAEGNSIISLLSYDATDDKIVNAGGIEVIEDEMGHGTAVAGVIAAQINGEGIQGVAPDVELLIIKCDVDETGAFESSADIIFGIYYAIEQDVDVINMSLGGSGGKEMEDALQLAVDSDIIPVAAAGNDASDLQHYPAAYDTVIGVGALADGSWVLADYSNFGINSDIVAPGTALTSAIGGGYTYQSGTSIAAPIVAAAAAIYKTQNPYATYEALKTDLLAAGKDLGDSGEDQLYGFGALDMNAFLCEEKGIITYDYCTEELENTTQVFVRQHTIQTVPEPERENIVFDDWYYDKAYTRVFDYDAWYTTEFVGDVTLYAKWVNEDDEGASVYNYRTLSDGTIEIVNYKGKRRYLTIPNEIDGKIVSSIGPNAFAGNTRLREVVFPEGLVCIKTGAFRNVNKMRGITFSGTKLIDIQEYAFQNCSSLEMLNLPDSVQMIGTKAFSDCSSMTVINIDENSRLTTIGEFAFSNTGISKFYLPEMVNSGGFNGSVLAYCSNMLSITVHPDNSAFIYADNTLFDADKTQIIYYPTARAGSYTVIDGVEVIGKYAFTASKITALDLNAVGEIGESAFESTKNLSSIVIPDTVTTMEKFAFKASSINQVTLSQNLAVLSEGVFFGSKLTSVHIPAAVRHIGKVAFYNCGYLKKLTFDNHAQLQGIGESAFEECHLLTDFQLPDMLHQIGKAAFKNCYALSNLTIPANVAEIGESAFSYCRLLKQVTFADGCVLTEIPNYCFANCTTLNTVTFSDGIIKLGKYAFSSNYLLKRLNFSAKSSLTEVDDYCFYTCSVLQTMQLPDTVNRIGQFAYAFSGLSKVDLSANMTSVGRAAFGACYVLEEITVDENNAVYAAADNVLFSKVFDTVYCVPSSRAGSYALPETVKITAPYSFYYDKYLTAVTLPENLEDIQMNSFYNCRSLAGITIPANVTNIGRQAFENCANLADVTFAANSKIQRLGIYTFVNCGFSEITIPASVESMAQYVFSNCNNLKTLRFEANSKLTYIAAYMLKGTRVESLVFENGSALTSLQAHAFDGAAYLKSVDFGDAVVANVDNYAFYGCCNLENIVLPDTVTYIGRYAFYNCNNLERMDIPAGVDYIGESAFYGTNNMRVFFAADELPDYVQVDWDKGIVGYFLGTVDYVVTDLWEYATRNDGTIALAAYKGSDTELSISEVDGHVVSRIGTGCFRDNDSLTKVSLGNNIKEIGNYAFYDCDALADIVIPASVERIGKYAFADSGTVVSLENGSVLESIDSYAFAGNATTVLNLPDSVTTIGEGAFYDSSLETIQISVTSELTTIGRKAFADSCITEIYIPANLETVGAEAFMNVSALSAVEIADGEKALKLSNSAFEGTGILEITIPARVNYIGEYTFGSCLNLEYIHVDPGNSSYTELGGVLCDISGTVLIQYPCGRSGAYEVPEQIAVLNYAVFKNAKELTEVTFAEGSMVKTIGWQTFSGCDSLRKIMVPDTVISFDFYAFENCTALTDVILGEESQLNGVYEGAFYGCTALENIMLPNAVSEIGDYAFYHCTSLDAFPLHENSQVKGIYDHAFDGCTGIKEIPVLAQLRELGEYAFANTGIKTYTVSADLKDIASNAFFGCNDLLELCCDEANKYYTAIDGVLYEKGAISAGDQEALLIWPYGKIWVIGQGKTRITNADTEFLMKFPDIRWEIADTVTTIGNGAFSNQTYLQNVILPESVEVIEPYAFSGCIRLENISLPQTLTQIGENAFFYCISLEKVDIPSSVSVMGEAVFSGCHKLRSVGPEGGGFDIEYQWKDRIPDNAFMGCSTLTNAVIGESITQIGESAFEDCVSLKQIACLSDDVQFGENVFSDCAFESAGPIGKGFDFEFVWTEEIPDYAFYDCDSLKCVWIPESITYFGDYAFYVANNLTIMYEGDTPAEEGVHSTDDTSVCVNVKSWGITDRFFYCIQNDGTAVATRYYYSNKQKTAQIPSATPDGTPITVIGNYAFAGEGHLNALTQVIIPETLTTVDSFAFAGCSVSYIIVPETITCLREYAFVKFNGLVLLDSEILPADTPSNWCNTNNAYLGFVAFREKDGMNFILLKNGTAVPYTYPGNTKELVIPSDVDGYKVKEIRMGFCSGNNNIIGIVLPDTLEQIGISAFSELKFLRYVWIPESVTEISTGAFDYSSGAALLFEGEAISSIHTWGLETAKCFGVESYGNTAYDQFYCITKDGEALLGRYFGSSGVVTIPAQIDGVPVKEILPYSFYMGGAGTNDGLFPGFPGVIFPGLPGFSSNKLTEVIIEDGVERIGEWAFAWCEDLEQITLPDSISEIGDCAFRYCTALRSCTLPEGLTILKSGVLEDCSSLTEVVLPISLTAIDTYAFWGCSSLEDILIPERVAEISFMAFADCSNLKTVYLRSEMIAEFLNTPEDTSDLCKYPKTFVITACADTMSESFLECYHNVEAAWFDGWSCNIYSDHIHEWKSEETIEERIPCEKDGIYRERCAVCDALKDVVKSAHMFETVRTEPTCTEQGYTTHTCANCGDSYVDSYVDALGHDMGAWEIVKEAACAEDGSERRDCSRCDHYETRVIKATGHSFGVWFVNRSATCTRDGENRRNCSNCSYYETEVIPATGHDYKSVITAPTCTEQGYTTHTCANCGDSYADSYVDALGHDMGAWMTVTEATCTEDGSERRDCSRCDHYETRTIKATGHSFGAWFVNRSATCTRDGENRRNCSNCSHYETEVIPATGHDYEAVVTAPTCTEEGCTTHTCANCGDSYVDSYTPALGHDWDDGVVTVEPTEETVGEMTYTCERCGLTRTEIIPELEHEHRYDAVVTDPTCTAEGYTTHTCRCGDSYVDTYVDALGHDVGEWVTVTQAACTEDGQELRECFRCDYYETRVIESVGHSYEAFVTAPTCTEQGYTRYVCSVCGNSYISDYVAPTGHDHEAVVTAPTCTEQGYTTYTCHCGDSYVSDFTDALGHDMGAWETAVEATCNENGEEIRECTRCDHSESKAIEALGHDWDEGTVTIEPTEKTEGEMTYTCERCGEIRTEVIPELEHEHRYEAVVTAPTCTEQGYTTHTCRCGDSYVDSYVDALGHDLGEWFTVTEATCTADGVEQRECSRCEHYETRVIEAAGHDYESVVTEPTCTEQGFTTHTCVNCGDSYTDSYTAALGHSFTEYVSDDNATCTQDGTKTAVCDRCDATDTVIDEGSAHGHDFTEWTVILKPTETAEGLESRSCVHCGVEETRTIARLENPFADVPSDSFYYEPVMWAVANGITNGTSATTFGPNDQCMRAHVVTFLWRAVGSPEPTRTDNPFVDVKESDFYYKAVMWALENGITSGMDATHFGPTAYCNRAQVVTFLYRTLGSPEVETTANPFSDVAPGSFYEKPVLWAVENGITNGLSATSFGPNAICNRAQIVTFLYRAFVTE